jgi:peptidoglycan/xylan/chitin deacetylase (PgdA/CDA1 family)
MFDAADVIALVEAGHEIGCATYGGLNGGRVTADAMLADMVRNADALAAMGLDRRLVSFAYPRGESTGALKDQLPTRFTSGRGAQPGLASGKADLAQLRANALFGPGALKRCLAVLEDARRRQGWAIFFAQDVSARPGPWGAPTGLLERLCGAAFTGGMRIAPVADALAAILAESGA